MVVPHARKAVADNRKSLSACHGRARIARRVLLSYRNGRRNAADFVDIRLVHALKELARIGRERFDIAALALGIDSVESERRFAGAADARDDSHPLNGNENEMFLRLLTRAPRTSMASFVIKRTREPP